MVHTRYNPNSHYSRSRSPVFTFPNNTAVVANPSTTVSQSCQIAPIACIVNRAPPKRNPPKKTASRTTAVLRSWATSSACRSDPCQRVLQPLSCCRRVSRGGRGGGVQEGVGRMLRRALAALQLHLKWRPTRPAQACARINPDRYWKPHDTTPQPNNICSLLFEIGHD